MKLLVYSDLHLDGHSFVPDPVAVEACDVVILAGDIDEGVKGFRWGRETFDKPIVMVLGNHEHYGHHWTRLLDEARDAALKFDIEFLECDAVDLGGYRFLGCTLWTDFKLMGDDRFSALRRASASLNDYRLIKASRTPELYWLKGHRIIPEMTASRHSASIEWLESEFNEVGHDPSKTVVITHHAPHSRSIPPRYKDDLLSAAYASDLSRLMGKAGLWIHGHIHDSVDYVESGTRVVCNPRGYPSWKSEFENPDFRIDGIWEI